MVVVNKNITNTVGSMAAPGSTTPQFAQMLADLQNANKVKDESSRRARQCAAPSSARVYASPSAGTNHRTGDCDVTHRCGEFNRERLRHRWRQSFVSGITTGSLSSIGTGLTDFGIGTAISLVTGSLAKSQQAQQQFAQAQAAWAGMVVAVAEIVSTVMAEQPAAESTAPSGAVVKRIGKDGTNVINLAGRRDRERNQYARKKAA